MKPSVVICITMMLWTGIALAFSWDVSQIDDLEKYIEDIANDIQTLQPRVNDKRANMLANIFVEAGESTEIDPKLLVAISFRESSFHIDFEKRERFGSRNEIGLMQCHGAALNFRPEFCSREIGGARCQILTGANYLAYHREYCGGTTWQWVASYGYGRCLSESEALKTRGVRNAKRYYKLIGGIETEGI